MRIPWAVKRRAAVGSGIMIRRRNSSTIAAGDRGPPLTDGAGCGTAASAVMGALLCVGNEQGPCRAVDDSFQGLSTSLVRHCSHLAWALHCPPEPRPSARALQG